VRLDRQHRVRQTGGKFKKSCFGGKFEAKKCAVILAGYLIFFKSQLFGGIFKNIIVLAGNGKFLYIKPLAGVLS